MKVGLFFGSFNPIHNGHIDVANKSLEFVDQVWFIISPHNPFKDPNMLIDPEFRYNMVNLAIDGDTRLKAENIEFGMDTPSLTHNTLKKLSSIYDHEFYLIFGADCVNAVSTWKEGAWIIDNYKIIAFRRDSVSVNIEVSKVLDSSLSVSSTLVRDNILNNLSYERIK